MKKASKLMSLTLLLAVVFSMVLAGCGSKPAETSPAATTAAQGAATTAAQAEAQKEPVTLKMTFWGSPQEKTAVEAAVKNFSGKLPYVTVEATQIPESDYDAKIAAMVASNDAPDYGYIHGQQGEQFAKEGKFINWFEQLKNDKDLKVEDFVDGVWFTLDPTNAWAVNTAVEAFGLFYNKDLFDAAGIAYPPASYDQAWTWDQFLDAAKKLTIDMKGKNASQSGFDPVNIKQFGVSFENWYGPVSVHVINNGGDYVSADGKSFALDKPEATNALQRLADLINVQHVAPSPIQAKAIPGQAPALQAKMIAMSMFGQWINLDLGAAKVNYGVAALPKMDKNSGTILISGASTMFKTTKNFDEAWAFAKFMTGEGVESLYTNGLWMPILKKYYTDPALKAKWVGPNDAHPQGFEQAFLDMVLNHSKPAIIYYIKNQAKIDAMINAALDPVWAGKQSAADAMKELAPKIAPEIQGRYDVQ